MWIKPATKQTFKTHSDIRSAFSDVSFPANLTEDNIAYVGLLPVQQVQKPEGYVVEELVPLLIEGGWTQQWAVRPPTETETATKASEMRQERNRLLTGSDWTQVKDAKVDQDAWATYRQALRDITQQAGFPWEITWPEAPQ